MASRAVGCAALLHLVLLPPRITQYNLTAAAGTVISDNDTRTGSLPRRLLG